MRLANSEATYGIRLVCLTAATSPYVAHTNALLYEWHFVALLFVVLLVLLTACVGFLGTMADKTASSDELHDNILDVAVTRYKIGKTRGHPKPWFALCGEVKKV